MKGHFDKSAGSWDSPDRIKMSEAISAGMLKKLRPEKEMTAVDIGTGTGLIAFKFADRMKHVYAVDNSGGMLSVLRRKIRSERRVNISPVKCDIQRNKPEIQAVDIVASSMSMHHIKRIEAFAAMILQMLKPGGSIAIADLDKEDGGFHPGPAKAGAVHAGFDREGLKKIFRRAGFIKISFRTVYRVIRTKARGKTLKYPVFLMTAKKPILRSR